jgi:predicted ATPase
VIASIAFRRFKALRHTHLALSPFNLVIGPNGSGKTSLIEAVLRLRTLAALPVSELPFAQAFAGPEIEFRFEEPAAGMVVKLGCESDLVCDTLRLEPRDAPGWPALRRELSSIRGYVLDHDALARPSRRGDGAELAPDGGNLAAVLAHLRSQAPAAYAEFVAELLRLLPEFRALELVESPDGRVEYGLRLAEGAVLPAAELSQGTLYLLAVLALAFDPDPPRVLCIEEVDRGIHPRMLREIRDALYRLSHPAQLTPGRRPVQIITTTHSPYFIDLFRDHPEEVVVSQKVGRAARFERLIDRPDLPELLREGSLGDMWFSGILGGIPEER